MTTEHRDYNVPEPGEENWHVPVNENWEKIDADMQAAMDTAQAALDAATSSDSDTEPDSAGTGFSWDQTHTDTSWLADANANNNLNVEVVTNLDSSGSGSLASAIDNGGRAPTLIVFEVGGVIDTEGDTFIRIREPHTYIAGQTAPWPGIALTRGGFRVHEANVILQHVGAFPGNDVDEPDNSDGLTINEDASNVMIDHCTFAWAPDSQISIRGRNASVINTINAEPLNMSSHSESPHGYAAHFHEGSSVNYVGNLHTHSWKRNPRPRSDLFWANCYQYNWGQRVWHGSNSGTEADIMGVVVEAGPDTNLDSGVFDDNPGTVYWGDNALVPSDTPMNDGNIDYVSSPMRLPSGLDPSNLVPTADLEDFLIANVGARPADQAPQEERIVNDFANRTGRIIDSETEVGGYPDYDTATRSLDPPDTDILDWLGHYTEEVEIGADNPLH